MAAFTEGFSNSGAGEGKLGQHLGKVISMVLEARQMASDERREAQKKLSEQAPGLTLEDFGIDQGYFFKKALQHEFGGEFLDKRKQDLKKLLVARRLLTSKKKLYVTARNFVRNNTRLTNVSSEKAASFRKKFNYKVEVESPAGLEDSSEKVAKAASGGGGAPRTKQDFLTAITEIAKSLQSTAQSINNAVDRNTGIASGIVSSQKNIVVEISHRTDTVSDKLEAIAAAVNKQTDFLKRAKASAKALSTENAAEEQIDTATTLSFDRPYTKKKDESEDISTSAEIDIHNERTTDLGDAEKGLVSRRVINGSPYGFKEKTPFGQTYTAHGTELEESDAFGNVKITPLANFATDGIQGNEVTPGGDLVAEKGMSIASMPTLPTLTEPQLKKGIGALNLSKTFNNTSSSTTVKSGDSQDMVDAMQLPFRAVGASLLKVTGEVRNRLGEVSPAADAKLNNITNVVANAFGLSSQDAITTKAVSEANARVRSKIEKKDDKDDSKWYDGIKNFFGNIIDRTGDMINSIGNAVVDGAKGVWNWLFGKKEEKNQENFSQKEIAEILINEFKKQGLSETGAQLATAEFMRETSLDQGLVLGSHMDGPNEAWGAGSYQGGREDLLFAHLNEKYGITKENFASSGKEGIQGQASFMLEEIASRGNTELLELLKKPSLNEEEKTRVRQLFKEAYFRYAESIPLDRSEGALKEIHKLLGVETSNFQSISTKDAFTATNLLEELNLGSSERAPEIAYIDLGAAFTSGSNAYTEQLDSSDDTLGIGSEWPLEIASYYPRKLHV